MVPGIGEASLAMLRAPGVNLAAEALPALINELADVSEQLVLVLDDYHAIEDERIHEGMASLIEHLPATAAHRDDLTRGAAAPSRNAARAGPAQRDRCCAAALLTFRSGVDAQ